MENQAKQKLYGHAPWRREQFEISKISKCSFV